jgi:hypothetical protein
MKFDAFLVFLCFGPTLTIGPLLIKYLHRG